MSRHLRIIYMGTPEFAVVPLKAILTQGYEVVAVITAPDKPAGRGRQLRPSAVKQFAIEQGLKVLQPTQLKNPEFLEELASLQANLQVVVAFRMLPEVVWSMPEFGTFNLHASLLPQYRGAAPINWAIINGEQHTGVSTFMLSHEIDTGKILFRESEPILPEDTAGSLHDRLAVKGSELVLKTLHSIENESYSLIEQDQLIAEEKELKKAPKIFREDCIIDWGNSAEKIHNLIRGLSPYPAAGSMLTSPSGALTSLRIFRTTLAGENDQSDPGHVYTDQKSFLKVKALDGYLNIEELQAEGKKRLSVTEFLRGFRMEGEWRMR